MASDINIGLEIERLISYGLSKNLIDFYGSVIARNNLFELLRVTEAFDGEVPVEETSEVSEILNRILSYCFESGLIPDSTVAERDLMSARVMGFITPSQADVIKQFNAKLRTSSEDATNYLYNLCLDVDYIKASRLRKNFVWYHDEPYGRLELINNFQASETAVAERKKLREAHYTGYPRCFLCVENVGFSGNLTSPSGRNLREIPIELAGKKGRMHYTPRQFYKEQVFLSGVAHNPRATSKTSFDIMLEFVERYPHYSVLMEADIEKLGNKFPEHAHFHGGRHRFPIELAEKKESFTHEIFEGVEAAILEWPVSVIRVECDDRHYLAEALNFVNRAWSIYSDEELGIIAFTEKDGKKIQHNAISAVVRKTAYGSYEADVVLRNNRTTENSPQGIFSHSGNSRLINKFDFGTSNIIGLAVYRGSFDSTLLHIISYIIKGEKYELGKRPELDEYIDWINTLVDKYGAVGNYSSARDVVLYETGREFAKALECCGVFKNTEDGKLGFATFMDSMGFIKHGYDLGD